MSTSEKTYYWDFFGPNALRTAQHFVQHLEQFLTRHALGECESGVVSAGEGHQAARCVAPQAAQSAIERSLRPNRIE